MATERYGAEGTFISPGTWRGPGWDATNWRLYFTDETRYPIMIKDLHQTVGSYTNSTIEVYDNHGQHYSHMVQQSTPGGGFGCTFTTSFARQNHVFQCVADKEFGNPLTPKLIDLVKANNIQTCIKAAAAATVDADKMTAELDAAKAELAAMKAEMSEVIAKRDAYKAEAVALKAEALKANTPTEKTAFMVASAVIVGILGLMAKDNGYSQPIMPPVLPMLPGIAELD